MSGNLFALRGAVVSKINSISSSVWRYVHQHAPWSMFTHSLSNCSHHKLLFSLVAAFFWLPVRAITALICISQLHLLSHPSVNQCTVKVSRSTVASLLLRLADYNHKTCCKIIFNSIWHETGPQTLWRTCWRDIVRKCYILRFWDDFPSASR